MMTDSWTWGTVTAASPLRVRLEHDSAPLDLTPDAMTAGLALDDRVLVLRHGTKAIVWGQGGPPIDDTGWVDLTLRTGWLTTASYAPQIRRIGNRVILKGALTRSGTTGAINSMFTVPEGFRPGASIFVGAVVTNGGAVLQVTISPTTGLGFVGATYVAGSAIASGAVVPLNGDWLID